MEMTEQRLAEIEARAKAAAPGEWVDHEFGFVFLRGDPQVHAIVTIDHEDVRGTSTADLSFIAHARTDVPALVAEVRRMRAENERLRAARDNAVDLWNRSLDDARRIETQRDEARRIAAGNEARYVAAERDLGEARRIAESRYQDIVDLDGRFRQREASIVSEARRWKVKAVEQSAEVRRLRAELATAREIADIADDVRVSQIKELYDVIDGSPDEPTDAELAAHRGTWLARLYNGAYATMTATSARNARGVFVRGGPYAVRWWALDPGERFCPRPVVTTVAATLGAGPRDGDGREVTP